MAGPLEGIRVVEMGFWVAGPSTAAILCDWGAEVIKIEPANGDPMRGLFATAAGIAMPVNPPFELDNRGKRSVALNLDTEEGRAIAHVLIDRADVFVTNRRPRVLEAAGVTYEELRRTNPRLVYLQVSGYSPDGPDRDRAAYDVGAFWSRAGVAAALTPKGADFPQQRGGMGDHVVGLSAAGAVCAALLARERTGEGQRVNVSLIRAGIYMMGWDVSLALRLRFPIEAYDRFHAINPLINCYQAGDGRWFWLLHLQGDRHWPNICRAIGREDLIADPRFAAMGVRWVNAPTLVPELDAAFATKSMAEWAEVFDRHDVWWAPINTCNEVVHDPVAHEAGAFTEAPGPEGPVPMVSTPVDFYGTPWQAQGIAPELGQHTEEVLLELGYDWDQIIALKDGGAIP